MKKFTLLLLLAASGLTGLSAEALGAAGAEKQERFSLEEMLRFAMEDEHLALATYQGIMDTYGVIRPYANIAESEKAHIAYLADLYRSRNMDIPVLSYSRPAPPSLGDSARAGVDAEIANIAMYDKFLKQDLPEDVRQVFAYLQGASEHHLQAFQRQLGTPGRRR